MGLNVCKRVEYEYSTYLSYGEVWSKRAQMAMEELRETHAAVGELVGLSQARWVEQSFKPRDLSKEDDREVGGAGGGCQGGEGKKEEEEEG